MDTRLNDILTGREENHLLPFLWMREGHTAELPSLMQSVYDSGARAVCVESRPHEGFCRQSWWDDMDTVLDTAEHLGMKVWILDDKHFPTGYAAGLIAEKYPGLRKWQLSEDHLDMTGPAPGSAALLRKQDGDEILLGVYAYPRREDTESIRGGAVDLTDRVRGRYVYWDVPKGVWRVFALYKTRRGTKQTDYIHPIDAESVSVLIEAVYEAHYRRYGRFFGGTIAGFFSDEPSFGNCQTLYGAGSVSIYNQKLGQPGLALPWSDELCALISGPLRGNLSLLPGLWYDIGQQTPAVRTAYMDTLTRLWREHFSYQLGNWCRSHGVEYIGHIIEDKNCHARLGHGVGHYFRALDGQDMAGIDVVLHQILPGLAHYPHAMIGATNVSDPAFFQYVLARLAASHSHIQPRMRGRAMCEIFGAYGWAEGVPMMKHLMDHMLVRGVNVFVPHAFSPDYPDGDCPPHFNAGGSNPGFEGFAALMKYTNQTAHLLGDGTEIVSAAILYHAEAEWSGQPYMLTQEPARRLYDAQLNYDILPIDTVENDMRVEDGALRVGAMRYPALLIPYAAWLPQAFLDRVKELCEAGARIAFIGGRPEGAGCGEVVSLEQAADWVLSAGGGDLRPDAPFPLLRLLHVRRRGTDIVMAVNESMTEDYSGTLFTPFHGRGLRLDLLGCGIRSVEAPDGALKLRLGRGESALFVFGDTQGESFPPDAELTRFLPLEASWTLTLKSAHGKPCSEGPRRIASLYNIAGPEGDDGFSGWMRYETDFLCPPGMHVLDLGQVGECARVWLNGTDLGLRVDAPYVFEMSAALREGPNHLTVEVTNSLVHQQPDPFSRYVQIPPSGLLGPVMLRG